MLRCLKLTAVSCVLLMVACEQEPEPESAVAHITQLSGAVSVRPGGHQASSAAAKDNPLYNDDIVSTGPDGKATLTFEGGNSVELGPNTSLAISHGGAAGAAVGAVLVSGTMKAASGGHGVRLSIGTPFGQAELGGTSVSVLTVSVERGLQVEVGTVDVVSKGGNKALKAGQNLAVDGVTVTTGDQAIAGLSIKTDKPKQPQADIVLQPMVVTVLGTGKGVELLAPGEKKWKLANKRVALKVGDQIRVKKGGSAHLQMGSDGAVNMRSDAVIAFKEAAENASTTSVNYALKSGGTQILLNKEDGKDVAHVVQVGGVAATVTPTLKAANVDMVQGKDMATVVVRDGQVQIGDGPPVQAGMAFELKNGKIVGAPRPIAVSKIELHPKSSVVVYYNKKVPAVEFVIPASDKGLTKIELAADKDFKQMSMSEQVSQSYYYDQMAAGKYYWRINGAADTRAVLQVAEESSTDCSNCKRTNLIDDTGEKTVVYFQQALPAIVLRWKENATAAHYNLKVFTDGEFDTPLVNEKLTDTKRSFDSGRFEEGKYYWLVTPLDKSGAEAAAGRMNSLQISYDNVITALVIRSPKQGIKTTSAHVPVTGEIELGGKLYLNGKRVDLDENNRFSESVDVVKGENQVVFRAVASDGVERYYLRDVVKQ